LFLGSFIASAAFHLLVTCRNISRVQENSSDIANDIEDNKSEISRDKVEEFLSRGVVVFPGVLSAEEITEARQGFHRELLERGVLILYVAINCSF
jgi:hypothetical protein